MRLIDRLTARSYLPDPQQVAFTSMVSTWGGDKSTERMAQTFTSYALFGFSSNAIVFSCAMARIETLSQAKFVFRNKLTGKTYTTSELDVLQNPWPNGTSADLIAKWEQHNSIAGNGFARRAGDQIIIMRPDWLDIVSVIVDEGPSRSGDPRTHREVIGYLYSEGGIGIGSPVFYDVSEVAHWSPMPDPLSQWRGMSWLTPVLREINADVAMTEHRQRFFDAAATPNLLLRYQQKLTPSTLESIKERWQARYGGPAGTGATVVLDEGADLTIVGASFESMRFNEVQNAGEARICAAARVPAIVAGVQAGLDASTFANYKASYRSFVNGAATFLWLSLAASLAKLVNVPADSELILDPSGMPALRDDEQDRANAMQTTLAAASTGLTAGFTAASLTDYLSTGDLSKLSHTGLVSVQLYKAAAKEDATIPALPVAPPPGAPEPKPAPVIPPPPSRADLALEAILARSMEPTQAPTVNMTIAEGAIQAHTTISDGAIRSETTVEAAQIRTDIHVPDAPAPVVNVENRVETPSVQVDVAAAAAPSVSVYPTVTVDMPARKTETTVVRDKNGMIAKTTSKETDA